jgi:hypothetical protein
MRKSVERCLVSLVLTAAVTSARAADPGATASPSPQGAQPSSPAPTQPPPAPPRSPPPLSAQLPVPPSATAGVSAESVGGQWAYTAQYGWLWMPLAASCSYVPPSGDPYMFVYSVGIGWRWVVAPWAIGVGPIPYFGVIGPSRFAWYGRWPRQWREARPVVVRPEIREHRFVGREHAFHEPAFREHGFEHERR